MIRVFIDIPDLFIERARYTICELAMRWDVPVLIVSDIKNCNLVYSTSRHENLELNTSWVQFDPLMYEPQTKCVVIKEKDCFCLIREGGNVGQADLIGGVWRLLSLLDETQIDASARDRMGTFRVPDLPDARRIHARTPIAEDMAKLIFLNLN